MKKQTLKKQTLKMLEILAKKEFNICMPMEIRENVFSYLAVAMYNGHYDFNGLKSPALKLFYRRYLNPKKRCFEWNKMINDIECTFEYC